jgi:hypothetical protein
LKVNMMAWNNARAQGRQNRVTYNNMLCAKAKNGPFLGGAGRRRRALDIVAQTGNLAGVLRRLGKFVLVLALACSIGLHWAFFQSLAWTSMLADNLRRDSLVQAVTHTFDGQHPCPICKAIADGKKSEKKSEAAPFFKTFEFPPVAENFVLTIPPRAAPPSHAHSFAETRTTTPPTPPPRRALA